MEKIHIVARFKIHAGQLDKFKNGSEACIAATKNESGALLYDWFINENDMTCTVIETYKDSNAVLAHVGNVNEPLSKLMEISDFVVEVFGNASVELQNALKEMNVTPVPFFGGL
jgi:quinol monooxygenase YgiN